jgi:hypothetical protein
MGDPIVDGNGVEIRKGATPDLKPEFTLHLVFDMGFQVEIPVTGFYPVRVNDNSGPLTYQSRVEQQSLTPGDSQVAYIDWARVVYAAVHSDNPAFQR